MRKHLRNEPFIKFLCYNGKYYPREVTEMEVRNYGLKHFVIKHFVLNNFFKHNKMTEREVPEGYKLITTKTGKPRL